MKTRKTVKTVWEVSTYDVWGNSKDGYDVNDRYIQDRGYVINCKLVTYNAGKPGEFIAASPSDYQIKKLFGVGCAIDTDGDDLNIYINRARDSYPIGQLVCVSHASLSPVRLSPSCEICGEPAGAGGALCPVHLREAGIE